MNTEGNAFQPFLEFAHVSPHFLAYFTTLFTTLFSQHFWYTGRQDADQEQRPRPREVGYR